MYILDSEDRVRSEKLSTTYQCVIKEMTRSEKKKYYASNFKIQVVGTGNPQLNVA